VHRNVLKELHKLSHDDEQRYRLLMRYLRTIGEEKKQRGFLKRFKKQWETYVSTKKETPLIRSMNTSQSSNE